jgi:hypothetical protein
MRTGEPAQKYVERFFAAQNFGSARAVALQRRPVRNGIHSAETRQEEGKVLSVRGRPSVLKAWRP